MSKRHKQFYRDTEEEPDSELEEEEDYDEVEELGLRDPVQTFPELIPSPSIAPTSTTPRKINTQVVQVNDTDDGEEVSISLLEDPNLQTYLEEMRQSPPWMREKEHSTYGSPAPDNVIRYENPLTGFPYLDRMREDIESAGDMKMTW